MSLEVRFNISFLYIFIACKITQFDTVEQIKPLWSKLSSRVVIPPSKKDLERGFMPDSSADMAMITKDSIVRLVEHRALRISLTMACCKLDIIQNLCFSALPFINYHLFISLLFFVT